MESTPEPVIEIVADESVGAEQLQIIVNTINTTIEELDPQQGKELILSFSYDTPVVFIESRPEAAAAINDVIAYFDEIHYTGSEDGIGGFNMMLEQAQDNYGYVVNSGVQGVSLEFTASRTAEVERADGSVLTITYDDYYHTGGAHGTYFTRGYSFDTVSGKKLAIEDLSSDSEAFKNQLVSVMLELAQDESISQRIDSSFVPEDKREEAFSALLREGSWYLTNSGITVFSDVYEFGPYALGEVKFEIPFEKLSSVIDEKWLPASRSGEAKLSINYLNEVADGSVEILDRIVLDQAGHEICISIMGNAYDVSLSSVDYTDRFFETQQHWYANCVENSAIQVVCTIPEGMPNLMLSFVDGEGASHRLLISQSGEDGKLLLVDDSIEAVG